MLQERIETLGSGILDFQSNNKVNLLGFNDLERLNDYYIENKKCFCSQGIYDNKELDWGKVKDNALFILIENNKVFKKYNFEVLYTGVIKFKVDKKSRSKVYKIRKCKYNNIYNFIIREKKIIDGQEISFIEAYDFESIDLLKTFCFNKFSAEIQLDEPTQTKLNI